MRFSEKGFLVVGGGTGMGNATVKQLVKEGANVVAFDIREDALEELKEELKGEKGRLHTYTGNVNNKEDREHLINFVKDKLSVLDGLIYTAGVLDNMTPAHDVDDDLWDYVMNVNVNSVFRTIREAIPLLVDHDGVSANIIIVGSVGGIYGSTAGAAYVTSKHAVLGLARNIAWTYRDRNVRVNVVNPGAVSTSILENSALKWEDRDLVHSEGINLFTLKGAVSLGEGISGEAEDIANAICFLVSDDARFINGAQLTVDGGWTSF